MGHVRKWLQTSGAGTRFQGAAVTAWDSLLVTWLMPWQRCGCAEMLRVQGVPLLGQQKGTTLPSACYALMNTWQVPSEATRAAGR